MKKIGQMVLAQTAEALESYSLAVLTRLGGKTEEEAKKICAEAVHELLHDRGVHAYNFLWHVYGRKP